MGSADVGDESAGRLGGFDERLDVARMAGTHLDDSYLVAIVQSEEGLGHAHVVVEIALCEEDIILLLQDGRNEFLGGCFAVGARDADDRDIELAAMLAGQVLESLETVGNKD